MSIAGADGGINQENVVSLSELRKKPSIELEGNQVVVTYIVRGEDGVEQEKVRRFNVKSGGKQLSTLPEGERARVLNDALEKTRQLFEDDKFSNKFQESPKGFEKKSVSILLQTEEGILKKGDDEVARACYANSARKASRVAESILGSSEAAQAPVAPDAPDGASVDASVVVAVPAAKNPAKKSDPLPSRGEQFNKELKAKVAEMAAKKAAAKPDAAAPVLGASIAYQAATATPAAPLPKPVVGSHAAPPAPAPGPAAAPVAPIPVAPTVAPPKAPAASKAAVPALPPLVPPLVPPLASSKAAAAAKAPIAAPAAKPGAASTPAAPPIPKRPEVAAGAHEPPPITPRDNFGFSSIGAASAKPVSSASEEAGAEPPRAELVEVGEEAAPSDVHPVLDEPSPQARPETPARSRTAAPVPPPIPPRSKPAASAARPPVGESAASPARPQSPRLRGELRGVRPEDFYKASAELGKAEAAKGAEDTGITTKDQLLDRLNEVLFNGSSRSFTRRMHDYLQAEPGSPLSKDLENKLRSDCNARPIQERIALIQGLREVANEVEADESFEKEAAQLDAFLKLYSEKEASRVNVEDVDVGLEESIKMRPRLNAKQKQAEADSVNKYFEPGLDEPYDEKRVETLARQLAALHEADQKSVIAKLSPVAKQLLIQYCPDYGLDALRVALEASRR